MSAALAVLRIWYMARQALCERRRVRQYMAGMIGMAGGDGTMDSDGIAGGDGMVG